MKILIFGRYYDGKIINLNYNICILKYVEYICIFWYNYEWIVKCIIYKNYDLNGRDRICWICNIERVNVYFCKIL